ncbi:HU family DNA-binding protein [Candidatus Woesearchaeota archaeon]|nr:HU family DNA-binding protein [Candidatus Woesearchaeota archaeon]
MVNKKELINMMAEQTGFTKKNSGIALEALISSIESALVDGENVTISGFGTFKVRETKAREARNPKTGEKVNVPAGKKPVFTFSKVIKESLKA